MYASVPAFLLFKGNLFFVSFCAAWNLQFQQARTAFPVLPQQRQTDSLHGDSGQLWIRNHSESAGTRAWVAEESRKVWRGEGGGVRNGRSF